MLNNSAEAIMNINLGNFLDITPPMLFYELHILVHKHDFGKNQKLQMNHYPINIFRSNQFLNINKISPKAPPINVQLFFGNIP